MSGLKYIKRIAVKFNPLDPRTTGVREFYGRMTTTKQLATNPKLVTEYNLLDCDSPPQLQVDFVDGENHTVEDASNMIFDDLIEPINAKSNILALSEMK